MRCRRFTQPKRAASTFGSPQSDTYRKQTMQMPAQPHLKGSFQRLRCQHCLSLISLPVLRATDMNHMGPASFHEYDFSRSRSIAPAKFAGMSKAQSGGKCVRSNCLLSAGASVRAGTHMRWDHLMERLAVRQQSMGRKTRLLGWKICTRQCPLEQERPRTGVEPIIFTTSHCKSRECACMGHLSVRHRRVGEFSIPPSALPDACLCWSGQSTTQSRTYSTRTRQRASAANTGHVWPKPVVLTRSQTTVHARRDTTRHRCQPFSRALGKSRALRGAQTAHRLPAARAGPSAIGRACR